MTSRRNETSGCIFSILSLFGVEDTVVAIFFHSYSSGKWLLL
jgi:hypothetical protein